MPNLNYSPETEIPDLSGKTIFITGGTNGLGAESALHLAKHNAAHIYISGRNAKSAEKVIQRIQESGSSSEITFIECDLASLLSVKKTGETFVSQASRLDILLCNAGIMAQPPSLTTDGYEVQFGTNHLGHALLIKKLLPLLEKQGSDGGDPRIIILTSEGLMLHPSGGIIFDKLRTVQDDFFFGGPWRRYGQSKLANLLFARELARRYPSIISASIHPGVVSTGLVGNQKFLDRALIYSTSFGKLLKPEEGAYNQVWAATTAKGNIENGAFYEPVGKSAHYKLGKTAKDDQLAERLWEWTQEVLEEF